MTLTRVGGPAAAGDGCNVAGTTVNFRSSANSTSATAANCTVAVPAGTIVNDFILLFLHYEKDTPSVTAPPGFTLIKSTINPATTPDSGSFTYYKVSTGTESSFILTFASGFRQCVAATYKDVNVGCVAGPVDSDVKASTYSSTANWVAPSITTTKTNDRSVITQDNFNGDANNAPAGYTERVDTSQMAVQDINVAAAGATGAQTGSVSASNNGGVIHFALID